mmetsp:Transcript_6356/g.10453  ORF Transcript_6356/g.10453 Transcript_6356/m.10453 type:complete len:236 (+) Transcript_6356:223-930(+)
MIFTTSLFLIKLETACPPSVRLVTVGERFPGVIFVHASNTSGLVLYDIIIYFLDVMYPSMRCFNNSTMSLCLELGLVMSTDSVSRTVPTISKPAAFMVVPVSTKSTTASANPRPHDASTDPDTNRIFVVTPNSLSNGSKNFFVKEGKLVTILFPARVFTSVILLATGACTQSLHLPYPKSITRSTSIPASSTMSIPVTPMSTIPPPTYLEMSAAGRKTMVMSRSLQMAMSRRGSR